MTIVALDDVLERRVRPSATDFGCNGPWRLAKRITERHGGDSIWHGNAGANRTTAEADQLVHRRATHIRREGAREVRRREQGDRRPHRTARHGGGGRRRRDGPRLCRRERQSGRRPPSNQRSPGGWLTAGPRWWPSEVVAGGRHARPKSSTSCQQDSGRSERPSPATTRARSAGGMCGIPSSAAHSWRTRPSRQCWTGSVPCRPGCPSGSGHTSSSSGPGRSDSCERR